MMQHILGSTNHISYNTYSTSSDANYISNTTANPDSLSEIMKNGGCIVLPAKNKDT